MASPDVLDTPKAARNTIWSRTGHQIATVLVGVFIVIAWQVAYSAELVSHFVLPSPSGVVDGLKLGLIDGIWWHDIWVTTEATIYAFVIGVAGGVAFGALFALVEPVRRVLMPYILAAQTFPKVAIAPMLVTWMGYGAAPKVAIGALLAFFPVLLNTTVGLKAVSTNEVELFKSMRASFWQELRMLRIPNAMSYIFPSLTLAAVVALLGVIVGEFVGSQAGLGHVIQQRTYVGDIAGVYAVLIILAVIGLLLYGLLTVAENRTKFKR